MICGRCRGGGRASVHLLGPDDREQHRCWGCVDAEWREEAARTLSGGLAHWRYDPARLVLVHTGHAYAYEVDPERMRTSAEVLDAIAQVAKKTWARKDPACIGELVIALDLLLDVQACLCSFGMSKRINPRTILRARHAELGLEARP